MIIRDFNNGWGPQIQLRQFEQHIIDSYLASWKHDSICSITVNSTWYNREYHSSVLDFMARHRVQRVALISFMDPAIVQSDWFDGTGAEIRSVGYYPGQDELDIWALIVDRHFDKKHECQLWSPTQLDTAFLCYNRKPHPHRMRLFIDLNLHNCIRNGVVTMGHQSGQPLSCLPQDVTGSDIAPNPGREQYGIGNDIMSLGPLQIWNRCFLNIVTETVFDVDKENFASEKIYKPVLGLRPFLIYAPGGATKTIKRLGLLSFIDDFADITDLDLTQPASIVPFLTILGHQPPAYFTYKYQQLHDKILHNRMTFDKHVNLTWHKINMGIVGNNI